jgi:hypothetical protein
MRAEQSAHSRNESAAMRAAIAALRREVDRLDVKMKEDLGNLKHEYVPPSVFFRPSNPFQDPNGARYPQERKQVGREAAEHRDRGLPCVYDPVLVSPVGAGSVEQGHRRARRPPRGHGRSKVGQHAQSSR